MTDPLTNPPQAVRMYLPQSDQAAFCFALAKDDLKRVEDPALETSVYGVLSPLEEQALEAAVAIWPAYLAIAYKVIPRPPEQDELMDAMDERLAATFVAATYVMDKLIHAYAAQRRQA